MQIKKTYQGVNPELLYDEVRDFVLKQGTVTGEAKLETYSLPSDSSTFISRGTLTCLLYTSPSPRDVEESRMPSSA